MKTFSFSSFLRNFTRMAGLGMAAAIVLLSGRIHAQENLIKNGDFEEDSGSWPAGWTKPASGGSWENENGNRFLRLSAIEPNKALMTYHLASFDPLAKELELSVRMRVSGLVVGSEAWFDARLIMHFKDSGGNKVGKSPSPIYFRKDTADWVEKTLRFPVPEGASSLEIMPSLMQVEAGTLDVDDLVLTATLE